MTVYNASIIQSLIASFKKQRTGILRGHSSENEVSVSFWQGEVISIQSNQGMESFLEYLHRNTVIEEQVFETLETLHQGRSCSEEILALEMITPKQLRKYQLRYQKYVLASSFEWVGLEIDFIPIDRSVVRLDLSIGLKASFHPLLWEIISSSIRPNRILPDLSDKKRGRFCFLKSKQEEMRAFPLPANLTKMFHWKDRKLFLHEITAEISDSSGMLFLALWLFEILKLVVREENLGAEVEIENVIESNDLLIELSKEHKRLMGTDYYEFLCLDASSSLEIIKEKSYQYFKKIQTFKNGCREVPIVNRYIQDLEQSLELVLYNLGDENRRIEYDRQLTLGQAEYTRSGRLGLPSIIRLIQEKRYEESLKELDKYEKETTAKAYRGWVRIQMGDEIGEEEIRSVLNDNPNHLDALKLIARLCFEQKKPSQSKLYVHQLLDIDPEMTWALELKTKLEQE
jgi:hypothetical protein